MRDNIKGGAAVSLLAANVSADSYSKYIDLKDYDGCRIILTAEMDTADSSNYITPSLLESDTDPTTPGSTASYSAVASADYSSGVNGFAALNDTTTAWCQEVAYIGDQRYICVLLDETNTAQGEIHIVAVPFRAQQKPVTAVPTTGTVS